MLLRFTLWGMLIGSIIMGYLGYQTGSTTTMIVGITAIVIGAFTLFFLVKMTLTAGLAFVKILIIIILIGGLGLLGFRGCQIVWQKGKTSFNEMSEKAPQIPGKIQSVSTWDSIKGFFSPAKTKPQVIAPPKSKNTSSQEEAKQVQNINGMVTHVLTGSTFVINNARLKLYGLDTPDLSQTCLSKRGEDYPCGRTAKKKLEKLLLNKYLECKVAYQNAPNDYFVTCTLQNYDVGATMVSVGWAVADRQISEAYVPYEEQAHRSYQGLWAGKFVAPWIYRTKQNPVQHDNGAQNSSFFKGLFK